MYAKNTVCLSYSRPTGTGRNDLTITGLQPVKISDENWSTASKKKSSKTYHISTYICLIDIQKIFNPQNTPCNIIL